MTYDGTPLRISPTTLTADLKSCPTQTARQPGNPMVETIIAATLLVCAAAPASARVYHDPPVFMSQWPRGGSRRRFCCEPNRRFAEGLLARYTPAK